MLFAYNAALLRGFLNFIISVGLALLLAAVWMRGESTAVLTSPCALGAMALFFCHLTGLLFFAMLIGGHELLIFRTDPFEAGLVLRRIAALPRFSPPLRR